VFEKPSPRFYLAAGVKTMSTYAASFNTFNATTIPSGLNRRGRLARFLVVLSLAVILLAGFAFTAGAGDVVSGTDSGSTNYVVLTVGSGDSIWSIARAVADGRDVRSVVDAIVTANSLSLPPTLYLMAMSPRGRRSAFRWRKFSRRARDTRV